MRWIFFKGAISHVSHLGIYFFGQNGECNLRCPKIQSKHFYGLVVAVLNVNSILTLESFLSQMASSSSHLLFLIYNDMDESSGKAKTLEHLFPFVCSNPLSVT